MTSQLRHDFKNYVMALNSMSGCQNYVMTSNSTSGHQIVCMTSKSTSWCRKIRLGVKKYVVTSKICHDIKKLHHDIKHDVKVTSWRQNYVMTSKVYHDICKTHVMTSKRTSWHQKVRHDVRSKSRRQKYVMTWNSTSWFCMMSKSTSNGTSRLKKVRQSYFMMSEIHNNVNMSWCNKRPVGLIAPPFKINFLATENWPKMKLKSVQILLKKSFIYPLAVISGHSLPKTTCWPKVKEGQLQVKSQI